MYHKLCFVGFDLQLIFSEVIGNGKIEFIRNALLSNRILHVHTLTSCKNDSLTCAMVFHWQKQTCTFSSLG